MKPLKISYENLVQILNKNNLYHSGYKYAHSYFIIVNGPNIKLEFAAVNDELTYCIIDGIVQENIVTDVEYLIKSWKLETL